MTLEAAASRGSTPRSLTAGETRGKLAVARAKSAFNRRMVEFPESGAGRNVALDLVDTTAEEVLFDLLG